VAGSKAIFSPCLPALLKNAAAALPLADEVDPAREREVPERAGELLREPLALLGAPEELMMNRLIEMLDSAMTVKFSRRV
jgi:hypothetical protein